MTLPHDDDDDINYKNAKADKSPLPSQDTTFPPPSENKIPREAWKVLAILSSIATMIMYCETMLVPAIPNLIKDFGITYSTSSWILIQHIC
jgi:hypothetical protein